MFPQVYPNFELPTGGIEEDFGVAIDPFEAAVFMDPIMMGGPTYDHLNYGMQGEPTPDYSDWLGYSVVQDTTWAMYNPSLDYFAEQSAPDFTIASPLGFLSHFPLTPSPPPSQTSTPERQNPALPQHEQSCRQASPFEKAKGKWSCDACGREFRGRWECKRHIENAGKRATCLACNKEINGRDDSLRRHFYKHCKRADLGQDSANLGFEDAFIHA